MSKAAALPIEPQSLPNRIIVHIISVSIIHHTVQAYESSIEYTFVLECPLKTSLK